MIWSESAGVMDSGFATLVAPRNDDVEGGSEKSHDIRPQERARDPARRRQLPAHWHRHRIGPRLPDPPGAVDRRLSARRRGRYRGAHHGAVADGAPWAIR